MSEPMATSVDPAITDSRRSETKSDPKGVLPKNLKPALYLGAAGLVIAAAFFSGTGKKSSTKPGGSSHQASQPVLQDNTDNNAQELRSQAAAAEQKMAQQGTGTTDPSLQNATPAQQAAAAAYGPNGQPVPCVPGQPCTPQQQQLSPAAQEEQQLAAKDRELAYASRFASNLVYTRAPDQPSSKPSSAALADSAGATGPQQNVAAMQSPPDPATSSLIGPRALGDPPAPSSPQTQQLAAQHKPEVNIDAATGHVWNE